MGRGLISIDPETLWEKASQGMNQKEIAEELGVSIPTLAKRMSDIREKQGILLKYRDLQSLHLTELQARILEAITPEKIEEAPLRDLVTAFKILKDRELLVDGKPTELKGLVGYLVHLEKEDAALKGEEYTEADFEEVTAVVQSVSDPEYTPDL